MNNINNGHASLTTDQQELVEKHMEYAMNMARKFRGRGVSTDDLQQEACLGLCEAALRYNADADNEFVTYAYTWCLKYIMQALRHNGNSLCTIAETITAVDISEDESLEDGSLGEVRSDRVTRLLSVLTPRERTVVTLVYGIAGGEPLDFHQIADATHLPRTQVKQLYSSALEKMQKASLLP